jgi:hypothetical protein
MGMLDDAIREHLELKKRSGAPDEEVQRLEAEVFGPPRKAAVPPAETPPTEEPPTEVVAEAPVEAAPAADPLPEPAPEPEPAPPPEPAAWLDDEPDEVPATEMLEHPEEGTPEEDVLEETPDFLQETPEHDRLWFEQKPPRDFDFDE